MTEGIEVLDEEPSGGKSLEKEETEDTDIDEEVAEYVKTGAGVEVGVGEVVSDGRDCEDDCVVTGAGE